MIPDFKHGLCEPHGESRQLVVSSVSFRREGY
jgi:hypothetical protein